MDKNEATAKRLPEEVDKLNTLQKDYQKALKARQQLDAQLNENKIVKEEMDMLEENSTIFKLIGPVLVKQDQEEAKQNVAKRIEYISAEVKRQEDVMKTIDEKQEAQRKVLNSLQQQMMSMKA